MTETRGFVARVKENAVPRLVIDPSCRAVLNTLKPIDVRGERLRDLMVGAVVMLFLGFAWLSLQRYNQRIDSSPPVAASAPTPRGRCYLGPSRVRKVAEPGQVGTVKELEPMCANYGCVADSIGTVYLLEEPVQIHCVADGDGRAR